ncbi:metaxin-2 [Drosophila montana]|uniref:metaxin-2 n=1 Tax=Drosophila montana TaxID=40370 RepID=UPI00313D8FFC
METVMDVANALGETGDEIKPEDALGECLPWPQDVHLYQPPEETQLLLPERASCLAVKTYLRMCRLPFGERQCDNAEFMSPGGRLTKLPLLRLGRHLFTEFEPIVGHVEVTQLSHALSAWLPAEEREDMRSMVTHAENTFTLAELHQCYLQPEIYASHTLPRNGAAHPWPLSSMRRHEKRDEALRLLRVYQWHQLDAAAVRAQLQQCCQLLSDKLEQAETETETKIDSQLIASYLYGPQLCELDALVFGHVAAILASQLVSSMLAETVRSYPRLIAHSRRIDEAYFQGKQLAGEP